MSQTIRAKFYVTNVTNNGDGEAVSLSAVTIGSDENKSFSNATPWGDLTIGITNPGALGFFKQGGEYYLDISPAAESTPEVSEA